MALFVKPLALGLALALAACAMPDAVQTKAGSPDGLMAWPDLLERDRPSPSTTIAYGDQIRCRSSTSICRRATGRIRP